jgi:sorting nexin-25
MPVPRTIARLSGAVLLLALIFPRLGTILSLPLVYLSFLSTVFILTLLTLAIRSDTADRVHSRARHYHALGPLAFSPGSSRSAVQARQAREPSAILHTSLQIPLSSSKALNDNIDALFKLIRESFIIPWYSKISPSSTVPDQIERLARQVVEDMVGKVEQVDWSSVMVHKILPLLTDHIHHYRSIEHLASTSSAPSSDTALPLPLPSKAHPALAQQEHLPARSPTPAIEAHLRDMVQMLLERTMPKTEKVDVVQTIVRETLLGAVVLPIFDMVCDSDFWNRQIDEKGGRYLHEQCVPKSPVQDAEAEV